MKELMGSRYYLLNDFLFPPLLKKKGGGGRDLKCIWVTCKDFTDTVADIWLIRDLFIYIFSPGTVYFQFTIR